MKNAIGMVEFKTVSSGMRAADTMVKTADVELLQADTVCPGKFLALISGDLSAVNAAVEAASKQEAEQLIDRFVLGNPHDSIFTALYGASEIDSPSALGVLETFSAAAAVVAADTAAKTALVDLIELRLARGMCGKSYMFLTGEVAAVQAAIERAKQTVAKEGMYLDSSVIARPDKKIRDAIL